MSFRVIHPGALTLLVDPGRPASRSLGVPLGGPADRSAFAFANFLVGNQGDEPALEIALSGPTLVAQNDVSVAIVGAPFSIHLDEQPIDAGRLFPVRGGQTLRIGSTKVNARAYLATRGGFEAPLILGARSALAPVAANEVLRCSPSTGAGLSLGHATVDELFAATDRDGVLRVVDGPQADWFPASGFFDQRFRVSPASNRMGIRLDGSALPRAGRELASEAVAPGAIQIANDGLPIILGVDGQTIGGYPKIAHVVDADLDRVGQLRPGQTVRFERVDLAAAERLGVERRLMISRWRARLRFRQPGA
jgi:antagonist of KipI